MQRRIDTLLACVAIACFGCGTPESSGASDASSPPFDASPDAPSPTDAAPPNDAKEAEIDANSPDTGHDGDHDAGAACVPLFGMCTTADTCCEGSCGAGNPSYVQCLLRPGDPCKLPSGNAVIDNCGPSTVCDPTTLKCVFPSCWSRADDATKHAGSKDSAYCTAAPGVMCCDPLTACTTITLPGPNPTSFSECCVPDGTAVTGAERNKCCNAGLVSGTDGIERCATIPPP